MNSTESHDRKLWVAAVLSLCCTGLGHMYCGRFARGMVFFTISMLLAPAVAVLVYLPPSGVSFLLLMAMVLLAPVVFLVAIIDAVLIANRDGAGFVLRDYNRPLVYVLFLLVGLFPPAGSVVSLRKNIIEAFKLPTESMAPTVIAGDRILVDKLVPGEGMPGRFDVVVFRYPEDRSKKFIKRVIGLPGDRVAVSGGEVILNGKALTLESDGEFLIEGDDFLSGRLGQ